MSFSSHLSFFGAVRLLRTGERIQGLRSRKAVALLAYLVVRNEPVSRAVLTSLFWPELDETRALANLSWVLGQLNKHLPGALSADRHSVSFTPGADIWVDLLIARSLLARADPAALAEAATLCQGELLEGFHLNGCREFEDWLMREREAWQRLRMGMLQQLIQHERLRGQYAQAHVYARRLIEIDPYNEASHRLIMLLLRDQGEQRAALAHYHGLRQMLADELLVEPSDESIALYQQIRDAHQALEAGSAAAEAPGGRWASEDAPLTPFFGRQEELAWLERQLRGTDTRLITVIGPGGIGKTRLALQLASRLGPAYQHGVAVVWLGQVGSPNVLGLAIATALRLELQGDSEPSRQLCNALRDKELLLILDNFEHLLEGRQLVLELLQRAPKLRMLITSRERLQLQAEQIMLLQGLELPQSMDSSALLASSAIQFFLERAMRAGGSAALSNTGLAAISQICQLVQGHALAIELAAAWAGALSPESIASQLSHDLSFLRHDLGDLPERHRSLRAVFDHSWALVGERERRVFARLAVFRGSFDLDGAYEVAGARLADLELLWGKSLLRRVEHGRFEHHEVLRHYAIEQLEAQPGEAQATYLTHCRRYLELAEGYSQEQQLIEQSPRRTRLELLYPDLLAALSWTLQQSETTLALRLAVALAPFWLGTGSLQEGCRWLKPVLALAEQERAGVTETRLLARCRLAYGALLTTIGRHDQALLPLQQALDTFEHSGDRRLLGQACGYIGRIMVYTGRPADALTWTQRQRELALLLDDHQAELVAYRYLGHAYLIDGHNQQALAYYEHGLALARRQGDEEARALLLVSQGLVYYYDECYQQAMASFWQALVDGLDRPLPLAQALLHLGLCYQEQGAIPECDRCLRAALNLSLERGTLMHTARILGQFGWLASISNKSSEAERRWQQAIGLFERLKVASYLPELLHQQALFYRSHERILEAQRCNAQALAIVAQHSYPKVEFNARLLDIQLQLLTLRISKAQAISALLTLREGWSAQREQAAIRYSLWQLDPNERSRQLAASLYRTLALQTGAVEYRQRYAELSGELLPAPALPSLPDILVRLEQPLATLLARLDDLLD